MHTVIIISGGATRGNVKILDILSENIQYFVDIRSATTLVILFCIIQQMFSGKSDCLQILLLEYIIYYRGS